MNWNVPRGLRSLLGQLVSPDSSSNMTHDYNMLSLNINSPADKKDQKPVKKKYSEMTFEEIEAERERRKKAKELKLQSQ